MKQYKILPGSPYPLGVTKIGNGINFAISLHRECRCILSLYQCGKKEAFLKIPFSDENADGTVYSVRVEGVTEEEFEYAYLVDDQPLIDPYSVNLTERSEWGIGCSRTADRVHSKISVKDYDWEGDQAPRYPFEQVIMYSLHVRGFTKHSSSGVKAKGTFKGIIEKIPYLIELGINQIELLPAYDFYELQDEEDLLPIGHPKYEKPDSDLTGETKTERVYEVNYWGFAEGFYFTPKASYADGKDAAVEFKDMVKALHKAGIEIIMQFYFPKCVNRNMIIDCIRYWVLEYHIDGVHLQGEDLPVTLIATNPLLADTKIYDHDFDIEGIYQRAFRGKIKNLAIYNHEFSVDMRRFLKSDEDMLQAFTYRMRRVPKETGVINYITQYEGFTLNDLVSYDYKHNEDNGEENADGNNYNCSCNYGIEGTTRNKAIEQMRYQQMRNAFATLLISQGTPLILAGDERGNSQQGNNNPYCQDNTVGWVQYGRSKRALGLEQFVMEMSQFRRAHPMLHTTQPVRMNDYQHMGCPDVSLHGEEPWIGGIGPEKRCIGIMYAGAYEHTGEKQDIYIALNYQYEASTLALPKLTGQKRWCLIMNTAMNEGTFAKQMLALENQQTIEVPGQSISILLGEVIAEL